MRRAAKTDATQRDIVDALRRVGCQVRSLAAVGSGCPDLLVRVPPTHRDFSHYFGARLLLLEVKEHKGKLNPAQETFRLLWPETRVVRSVDEALAVVGAATLTAVER